MILWNAVFKKMEELFKKIEAEKKNEKANDAE